jgi:hypothetical protein
MWYFLTFLFHLLEKGAHPYICVAEQDFDGRAESSPFAPFKIFELREDGSLILPINANSSEHR